MQAPVSITHWPLGVSMMVPWSPVLWMKLSGSNSRYRYLTVSARKKLSMRFSRVWSVTSFTWGECGHQYIIQMNLYTYITLYYYNYINIIY